MSNGSQIVYGKYLNNCDDVRKNLTDWLNDKNIVLVPMERESMFPLLSIMYIEEAEEYCLILDSIEKAIQDLDFRGLLVLIHEDTKPRRQEEKNVFQLRSEKTVICTTRQNENEIKRMMEFIKEKAQLFAFAFDRTTPDKLLIITTEFVENELNIKLVPAQDVKNKKSPLLVICKNDSQLQEDIDNAKRKTRAGEDVMLLVVTASENLQLVDTKSTKEFGSKAKLKWDFHRQRFSRKENQKCIEYLKTFFQRYGCHVRLSHGRIDSRNFRQKTSSDDSDKIEKDVQSKTNSLIFFKTDKALTDEHIPFFCDRQPLSMKPTDLVVHLCCNSDKVSIMSNTNSERPKETMAEANVSSTSKTVKQDNAATPLPKECSVKSDDGNEEAFEKK